MNTGEPEVKEQEEEEEEEEEEDQGPIGYAINPS